MDTQVADTLLGSLIAGRYRIRARIARGGMATVYTATDERLGRTVAVKIIHPAQARDAQARLASFLEHFNEEAKAVARLPHPNVVAVYDQGTHANLPYLVMEYVRGRTLRDILAERRRLSPAEALAVLEQMLAAIAAAHRAGLVHRDVKPENVLIAESPSGGPDSLIDCVVKVADFGLARAVAASADDDGGSHLMATAEYVAPELVTNGHADPRTDVYSAGIVLFEMLTGRVPYDGDRPAEVAWQHVDRDVPPPSKFVPGLPPALDDLVIRATRRHPSARPTDAGAFMTEVQGLRENLGNTQAHTAVLPQIAEPPEQPTMLVPAMSTNERPTWARLPEPKERSQPHRRRAEPDDPPGLFARLNAVRKQLMADPRGRQGVIAALVVLGLLATVGGWWFGFGRYTDAPPLVNLPRAAAEAEAAKAGLTIEFGDGRHDENVAKDVVLAQDPPAGGRIVKGGKITLTLSLGPERYEVPDVVGKTYDLAVVELEKVKLTVKRGPDRFNDDLPAGVVISVKPEPGAEVKPGDEVIVTVSKGQAPITVPNLVGKNINEARAILSQLGLVPRETYKEDGKPKDEVIGQSPADGSGVEKGAEIKLDVSTGPPMVTVPHVVGLPCQEAKQQLEGQNLRVEIHINPDGTVHAQNPGAENQVPPQSTVTLVCA
ncbi:MAG TPA: Stk1 family PASTA domain-containing Ser/Thr kinase [Micromonosporaceae bacterium]|nr:Stk1 family PASTA domain-containing Ser/Thr kinase [Micromonosporaceae bacterium]